MRYATGISHDYHPPFKERYGMQTSSNMKNIIWCFMRACLSSRMRVRGTGALVTTQWALGGTNGIAFLVGTHKPRSAPGQPRGTRQSRPIVHLESSHEMMTRAYGRDS